MKTYAQRMGFVTRFFIKPAKPTLVQLPSGSLMFDRTGRMTTSTVPKCFPTSLLQTIGEQFLDAFESAKGAGLPLAEIIIHYPAFKLVGRDMRGGAVVFLHPATDNNQTE